MWACWAGVVKGAGMPCLRYARISQREKFMNGTTSLWQWLWWCVFICVFMCAWQGATPSVEVQFPSFSLFSSEQTSLLSSRAVAEHPLLLKAYWSWCFLCQTVLGCVCVTQHNVREVPGWSQARACCSPDEKLRKRLNFSDILSLLGIWWVYWCGVWLCVCVCRFTGVAECVQ